jgi:hypothetical protein
LFSVLLAEEEVPVEPCHDHHHVHKLPGAHVIFVDRGDVSRILVLLVLESTGRNTTTTEFM